MIPIQSDIVSEASERLVSQFGNSVSVDKYSLYTSVYPDGGGGEPEGMEFAMLCSSVYPFLIVHKLDEEGLGVKFADPVTPIPGKCYQVAQSPNENIIVVGHWFAPYVAAYHISENGFGVKLSNPATTLEGPGSRGVAFSPDGTAVVMSRNGSSGLNAYQWTNEGFGVKLTNPSGGIYAPTASHVHFSPSGETVVCRHTTGNVDAFHWETYGLGSKTYPYSGTRPATGVAFTKDSKTIAFSNELTNYGQPPVTSASSLNEDGTTPIAYPDPPLPPLDINGRFRYTYSTAITFSPLDDYILVGVSSRERVVIYEWSQTTGFGNQYPQFNKPFPNGDTNVRHLSFSVSGKFLGVSYKNMSMYGGGHVPGEIFKWGGGAIGDPAGSFALFQEASDNEYIVFGKIK